MSVDRHELSRFISDILTPWEFDDYGPNGLQIEGTDKIKKIAFAVSATSASISEAIEKEVDTLIVHHGLFWKFHGSRPLTGTFGKRVIPLVQNNMNLFGYHLPLDAHSEIGNAAQIGKLMGMRSIERFGEYKGNYIGIKGEIDPCKPLNLKRYLEDILEHTVMFSSPNEEELIKTIGIITGGAANNWTQAKKEGLDAYLTGEMSEHHWHESKEAGIHMFAGGHNATEEFGIQKLQELINDKFQVETIYIKSENPA